MHFAFAMNANTMKQMDFRNNLLSFGTFCGRNDGTRDEQILRILLVNKCSSNILISYADDYSNRFEVKIYNHVAI